MFNIYKFPKIIFIQGNPLSADNLMRANIMTADIAIILGAYSNMDNDNDNYEIIGRENLYILDSDTPPLLYPSPNQLKKKFIIKNKRKRILGDLVKMQNSYEKNYMNTLEQMHKKNESQKNELLLNITNSDLSNNDNSENSGNKILKKSKYLNSEIIGMSMTPNDNNNINNNNTNKNYNIINEIIIFPRKKPTKK